MICIIESLLHFTCICAEFVVCFCFLQWLVFFILFACEVTLGVLKGAINKMHHHHKTELCFHSYMHAINLDKS